jgi:hypothetical protein
MPSVTLSWDALPEDSIAVYTRAYEIVGGAYVLVAVTAASTITVTFAATVGTHQYILRTVDDVGNESDISTIIEVIVAVEEEDSLSWSSTGCIFSVSAPEGPEEPPEQPPQAPVINPYVILQWSDDGGFTWSNEHWVAVGRVGEFRKRMKWNRLGRAKNRVFKITVSDPCKWVFTNALVDLQLGK